MPFVYESDGKGTRINSVCRAWNAYVLAVEVIDDFNEQPDDGLRFLLSDGQLKKGEMRMCASVSTTCACVEA